MKSYQNMLDAVGQTPLLKVAENLNGSSIWVKLENLNPLGSVKDRAAVSIIRTAVKDGKLVPDGTVIEATSGNMGIGLAMATAALGYRLLLTMPDSMSSERIALLKQLGAELVLTPAQNGMAGAIAKAKELANSIPGSFLARQFENPANPQAHYQTTGPEIWEASEGKVDIFIAGVGTGGTITGVGRFLKEKNRNIKIIAVEPEDSAVLSGKPAGAHGIQGLGAGFVPANFDRLVVDEIITVSTKDALAAARLAASKSSILCGISSGANLHASQKVANRLSMNGKNIVTIACDTGERYISTELFNPK
ncbi:MAG: cysteine synthase A [Victivallaceae bacterium]|nr:cysteine synthase A [Victivallaceae bacterium]MDD4182088.1 cysteine synthase A [Victivallaceae bacterium]